MLFAGNCYLAGAILQQLATRYLFEKIGVDGMFVEKRDAMGERLTPGAHLSKVALGHGELSFGLVPRKQSAFAEDAAIAEVERDRAADRGDHHHIKVICKAATQSHDTHGITTRFIEQAKSSVEYERSPRKRRRKKSGST